MPNFIKPTCLSNFLNRLKAKQNNVLKTMGQIYSLFSLNLMF